MSNYAAIILAAGQGSRFRAAGGTSPTKLVAPLGGQPIVRHVATRALASQARPVVIVTGHARDTVASALDGLGLRYLHNADFTSGLAGTLRLGIAAVPAETAGAVVLLGDMPGVSATLVDLLIDSARANPWADAVVPIFEGRRGNPVLLARSLFARVGELKGDAGARQLLNSAEVFEVAAFDKGILVDIDAPGDISALEGSGLG